MFVSEKMLQRTTVAVLGSFGSVTTHRKIAVLQPEEPLCNKNLP